MTGTFRIDDLDLPDSVGTQRVRGRITTKRGTTIDVAYSYHQTWVDCLIYYLPRADAEGRFYISRRMRDGRYELVDWSGDYVAGKVIGIQDED